MNIQSDPDATPRPLHLTKYTDDADRTPYIPRRKSSVGTRYEGSCQDVSSAIACEQSQKPSHVWPRHRPSNRRSRGAEQERRISKSSEMKFNSSTDTYNPTFAQSHQELRRHDRSSVSSSESRNRRRLFSRILSSFSQNNNSANAISNLARSLGAGPGQLPRLSGSTARDSSLRTTSTASTQSTNISLVRVDTMARSVDKPNSPNPLRAPPVCLLVQDNDAQNMQIERRHPSTSSMADETPSPALATATLHCIPDVTNADREKATTVWVAVDVQCDIHYTEDPRSSVRSQALGPPSTDPGFLTKLGLDLTPASGCSIVRLLGYDNREFLLPGETWSVVAQILADPPIRRKQPIKAFSLQHRPSSHALMDQLHTMLSPSDPSSQELVHVNVSFEHVLLPSTVQCCVSEKLNLERVSPWCPDSRRQYLRHRQSPRKAARGLDQQQRQRRDEIACKLLDVLELNLQTRGDIGHREAIEILGEFFDQFEGSTRLHQRARELIRTLESKIRPSSRPPVSPIKRRRNGLELSRENLQLQDITNKWSGRSRDVITPAPLFSPRKRPSVANLHSGSPSKKSAAAERRATPRGEGVDIGSPRFYEDELDEASRIWKAMRDSSGGSSVYAGMNDGRRIGIGDGNEEENGRGIVGAPWL